MAASADDPKKPGGRRRPEKVEHAHDEFELDISVDTDMTRVAAKEVLPDLFSDLEEEATEILTMPTDAGGSESRRTQELPVSTALEQDVLPVFVPMTPVPSRKPPPPPPPPPKLSRPVPATRATPPPRRGKTPPPAESVLPPPPPDFRPSVEDLSSAVFERPGMAPLGDLSMEADTARSSKVNAPIPGPGETSDPAIEPLDISQFAMSTGGRAKKTTNLRSGTTDFKGEPLRGSAPMAQPQRVVRTLFTIGTREILLFLVIVLLGAGLWLGWMMYDDYAKRQDMERLESQRAELEDARKSAIDGQTKPREKDIP